MVECCRCNRRTPAHALRVPPELPFDIDGPLCDECAEQLRVNLQLDWLNENTTETFRGHFSTMEERRQERRQGAP